MYKGHAQVYKGVHAQTYEDMVSSIEAERNRTLALRPPTCPLARLPFAVQRSAPACPPALHRQSEPVQIFR